METMEKTGGKMGGCCGSGCCHSSYILRLALGGMLLVAGILKFKGGMGTFVDGTAAMFTDTILPMAIVKGFLTLVPLLEVVLGAMILLGLFTRYAANIAGYVFALFVIGLSASGKMEMGPAIAYNFIYIYAALKLAKKSKMASPLSLDKLLCGSKCDM